MSIQKAIKNSLLTANGLVAFSTNQPIQYLDKQHQYFSPETKTFTQKYAKYSSNFFEAQVQGIDPTQPFAWQTRMIRIADIVKPSAAILRRADNYKIVLFADREIEYLMPGAKISVSGSTWLVTNPFNISAGDGATIVQRCNAVWNYLDYYGNVVSEPMVVSNTRADANDSDAQEANLITKGYFNVTMQYNDVTAQIDTNTRFILGTGAYRVTGYSDFQQEFTGDYGSVRLLEFTIRYEEPNDEIDDMVNHVASGKTFAWNVQVVGQTTLRVGESIQLSAISTRNGEIVQSTAEHPITYSWISSGAEGGLPPSNNLAPNDDLEPRGEDSPAIATVDEDGVVTAVSNGTAIITATLNQNDAYSANIEVVVEDGAQSEIRFTTTIPSELSAYDDCEIGAAWYENGTETSEEITWEFSGADQSKYRVMTGTKTAEIYCFGYSEMPLVVTARRGTSSITTTIRLNGI